MMAQPTELPAYLHGVSTQGTTCLPTWLLNPRNSLPINMVAQPKELPDYLRGVSTQATT